MMQYFHQLCLQRRVERQREKKASAEREFLEVRILLMQSAPVMYA